MQKQFILYNLAEHVTDEQYKDYVIHEKGPLLESLSTVRKFELVKVKGPMAGKMPYSYVGILHVTSMDEFNKKDAPTKKFQDFGAKWRPMTKDVLVLYGDEIY